MVGVKIMDCPVALSPGVFAQQERQHKCNGQRQQQFASHINEGVHDGCLEHSVPGNAGKICKAYKFWGAVALVVKHTVPYCPQDGVDGENNKHDQGWAEASNRMSSPPGSFSQGFFSSFP